MRSSHHVGSVVASFVMGALGWSVGCGGHDNANNGASDGGPGSSSGGDNIIVVPDHNRCTANGQCVTTSCNLGSTTTLSGTVYDPAGNNPLSGVAVYVPSSLPLEALPKGASCGDCSLLYKNTPLASAITKADGTFTIIDPPVGQGVPIVVQAGKWRKVYSATVNQCMDNKSTTKFQLPKSMKDGDASTSLPDIAISTGALDSLECMLTRVGVATSEFTNGASGPGHIHIFQGGGATNLPGPTMAGGSPSSATSLWNTAASLQPFDVVLLSCEGNETAGQNPAALGTYVQMGGRVFASHFHYSWFTQSGSPFSGVGQFQVGSHDTGNITGVIDTSFAQGQVLHDWLALPQVAALTNDQLPIQQSRQNVVQVAPPALSWIKAAPNVSMPAMRDLTEYFSFDVRVGEITCGRVVYSDLHAGAASSDYGGALMGPIKSSTGGITPTGCNIGAKLSPQELVLEYMLFDLSSCLTPPFMMRTPPPIPK